MFLCLVELAMNIPLYVRSVVFFVFSVWERAVYYIEHLGSIY